MGANGYKESEMRYIAIYYDKNDNSILGSDSVSYIDGRLSVFNARDIAIAIGQDRKGFHHPSIDRMRLFRAQRLRDISDASEHNGIYYSII
jgi:hypothetical protein